MTVAPSTLPALAGGTPVRDRFLVFGEPLIGEEEIAEVVDTLRSGWIGFGPKCVRFEEQFQRYVQAPYVASVGSCTAGLYLSLICAGVTSGDEVITTPLTFAATANVIEHAGARPVFVDVDRRTHNLDPNQVEAAFSPRTRAIMPVHMEGRPCDMDAISALAARRGVPVIEDAAHAVESVSNGRKIGSISAFTVFSFYATKNLTTAEGGMVATTDPTAADRIRVLRLHGLDKDAWRRYSDAGFNAYEVVEPGYKFNMTDLQASLGLHQLARLDANLAVRTRHWQAYDAAFRDLPLVETPAPVPDGDRHARHLYTILPDFSRLRLNRQTFLDALKAEGIGAGIHFTPVHLHAYYRAKYGYKDGDFPHAEEIGARTVSLPLSARLSDSDAQDVIETVTKILRYYARC